MHTVITRKLWNRKTTLWQYSILFDVVTKQMFYQDENCCVPRSLDHLKLFLDYKSRLPNTEFSGYHCNKTCDLNKFWIKNAKNFFQCVFLKSQNYFPFKDIYGAHDKFFFKFLKYSFETLLLFENVKNPYPWMKTKNI